MPNAVIRFASLALLGTATTHAAVDFEKQIWPVIETKCLNCHAAPKVEDGKKKDPKGDLRMDAAWAILKGGKNGPVIKAGESAKSTMYQVVTLPKDDDDFMPSKGDPLTEAETKLLKEWIDEGAKFGAWKGNMAGAPPEVLAAANPVMKVRAHDVFYKELEAGLKPATDDLLAKAKAAGAQVSTLKGDSPLLRADFLTGVSKCDDAKIETLLPLKEHLAQLDLGRTIITDVGLKTVAQFPRLASLDLRQTKVTDGGLIALTELKKLQSINLYGTEISDAGIKHLAAIKSLKHVTLWQTKVTEAGAKQLAAAIPGIEVTVK